MFPTMPLGMNFARLCVNVSNCPPPQPKLPPPPQAPHPCRTSTTIQVLRLRSSLLPEWHSGSSWLALCTETLPYEQGGARAIRDPAPLSSYTWGTVLALWMGAGLEKEAPVLLATLAHNSASAIWGWKHIKDVNCLFLIRWICSSRLAGGRRKSSVPALAIPAWSRSTSVTRSYERQWTGAGYDSDTSGSCWSCQDLVDSMLSVSSFTMHPSDNFQKLNSF